MTSRNSKTGLEEPFLASQQEGTLGVIENEVRSLDHVDGEDVISPSTGLWDGLPFRMSAVLKLLYFLEGLGASTWGRFAAIYYNLHGLSPKQVGLLGGLMPIVSTVAQPMWSMAADVWFGRKTIYLLCRMAGTTLLLTLALPTVYRSIPWIFAVSLLTVTFSSSGILDAYTLELLGETNKTMYGRYRMWCALSWGAGAVCMGWLTDRFGFEWNFILYGFMGILSCLMIAALVPQRTMVEEQEQEQGKIGDLICLFTRPRVVLFCLELILVGGAMATVERLLFLYLVDDLGASTFLCGLSVGVTVLLELPTFWCADWLLRWLGHDYLVAVSMLCFVVRTYGYTLLTPSTVTWVLALEIMHGITFACFWISVMDVTKILSRQVHGWNTTIPVLTNTIFQCVGGGLGSILGGWTMNKYGSKYMYHGISTIMLVALVLHVMGALVIRYCGSCHYKTFLPTENEQDHVNAQRISDPENEDLIDKDMPFL